MPYPVSLTPLPPKDAIAYFRQKGLAKSFAWQDVWQEEHAKAFTVAKAMSRDVLEDIRNAMDTALAEGQTLAQFKAGLTPLLQQKGWWGRKTVTDPLTGKEVKAQLGSDRRLKTIFQTNMRTSYAVGNWQRAQATKAAFPYMVFQHNSDRYPRPQHVAWSGTCLPVDDPWWDTHYPPCAWGCNCSTYSLSTTMASDRGIEVTKTPVKFPPKTYTNPRTGEVSTLEEGIDPGWNYNVGKAPLRGITARPAPSEIPAKVPAPKLNTAINDTLGELGAQKPRVMKDRDGWPVVVSRDLFRDIAGGDAVPRPDLVDQLPKVAEALKHYDHVDWVWSETAPVPPTGPDPAKAIGKVVDGEAKSARYAKAAPWLVDQAEDAGLKIDGFTHSIDQGAVEHITKKHGDVTQEHLRGQHAVTRADLTALPQLVAKPDYLIIKQGPSGTLPRFLFVKRLEDRTLVLVEELRNRHLAAKTYYQASATIDVADLTSDPDLNAQNDSGYTSKIVDLRGKINAPAAAPRWQMVRRYTKTIDNQVVTVDFSRETWTFDVVPLKSDKSGS